MVSVPHLQIAIVLIWREGKVLVQRRRADADHVPGMWEFPGGKCRPGETPSQCAVREVCEETGAGIEISGAREPFTFDYPERRVTLHPFDAVIVQGEPQPLGSTSLRWLHPAELKIEDFPAANAALLQDIGAKQK